MKDVVWTFTNKKELGKKEFLSYIEKKIFKTIRKYQMLPRDFIIRLKIKDDLNTKVLENILSNKFTVKNSSSPDFSSENLSDIAEEIFNNLTNGIFNGPVPEDKPHRPLYFVSDKELYLYAKLKNIKGKKKKRNKKIQDLFRKFLDKNPDLELNVVKVLSQIKD